MAWESRSVAKPRRDEIELVAVTAGGEGEIPAGEIYFAGTDWRSGDLICVRADDDGNVRVERRSRFGGVLMHEPVVLERAVAVSRWFDAGDEEGEANRWSGCGWVFEIVQGGRGVLRRGAEGAL